MTNELFESLFLLAAQFLLFGRRHISKPLLLSFRLKGAPKIVAYRPLKSLINIISKISLKLPKRQKHQIKIT